MATCTRWVTSLLDEAAAIIEAEWIRLQRDAALWERELADLLAETPTPRPGPPRVGITTTGRWWRGQPIPDDRRRWPPRRWLPVQVWATQRSPPPPQSNWLKRTVGQGLTALHGGVDVRSTIPPPVAPGSPVGPGVTGPVLGDTSDAQKS